MSYAQASSVEGEKAELLRDLKQAEMDRETGHVRALIVELDENTNALIKAIDSLGNQLRPVRKEDLDDGNAVPGTPQPARCMVADELARVNERVIEARRWLNRISDSLDV